MSKRRMIEKECFLVRLNFTVDAEAPILSSLDVKSQLIGKDPDAGKD